MTNSTVISTLNCKGVVRSTDYFNSFIDETSCVILCLQELWLHENDLAKLGNINCNYNYVYRSFWDFKFSSIKRLSLWWYCSIIKIIFSTARHSY